LIFQKKEGFLKIMCKYIYIKLKHSIKTPENIKK